MARKTILFIGDTSFDNYQSRMLSGAMKAASECDINLVRFIVEQHINSKLYRSPFEMVKNMIRKINPDGLIFLGWLGDTAENRLNFVNMLKGIKPVPYLSIGRIIKNVPSIYMNGPKHIEELLIHLHIKHGFKNIAFVKPITLDERYQAYEDYMKKQGIFNSQLVLTNEDLDQKIDWLFVERTEKIIKILFDKRKIKVEAIMSMYSHEAVNILQALKNRGFKVPDDIALTSWEDGERSRYAAPSITSVYYPFYEQAYEGVKIVARMIDGEKMPLMIEVPGRMSIRRSCGCYSDKMDHAGMGLPVKYPVSINIPEREDLNSKLINSKIVMNKLDKKNVLKTFLLDINEKSGNHLLNLIDGYVYTHDISLDDLYSVQEDILSFRSFIMPYIIKNPGLLADAEDLWLKCQISIEENIESVIGFNEVLKRGTSHFLQEISQNIVITFNIKKLQDVLDSSLRRIKVPSCHIFIFSGKENLMSRDTLIYSYQNNKRAGLKSALFSFEDINQLKNYLSGSKRHAYVSYILHIRQDIIGYVLYEPGPEDERIYYALSVEVSSAIHGAMVLDNLKKANNSLRLAQKEIITNMDVIKEKTAALEESNKKLAQLDKLKNDFIANITHDFRSHITIVLNSADLGMRFDDLMDMKNTLNRYDAIYNAALKLKTTIDRLLDLAKMDAQGIKLNILRLDVKSYLENIINFYRSAVFSSGIQINYSLPSYEIKDFYTDLDKLEEILHNVISNAIKFINPEKGIIEISLQDRETTIEIIVSDNGIGIPKDKLEVIFERFEQLEDARKSKYKGTGIGLSFTKELIGYLRGSIRAESGGLDKGARFIMEFQKGQAVFKDLEIMDITPEFQYSGLAKRKQFQKIIESSIQNNLQKNEMVTVYQELNRENEYDFRKGIILIIDDDADIREIVKNYLDKAGYRNFISAANVKEGIEAIYHYRPDLIICDYNMPGIQGDELYDWIISNPDIKRIPVLFLTAVADKNMLQRLKQKGILFYLNKPLDEKELLAAIDSHLKNYMELKSLLNQISIDELTGLYKKPEIIKFLKERIAHPAYRPLSIIMIEVDGFKKINNEYGHTAGNALLAQCGRTIKESIRSYDKAGRYGGEKFLLILPETALSEAEGIAEKLHANIKSVPIQSNDHTFNASASFGISSLTDYEGYISGILNIGGLKNIFEAKNTGGQNSEDIKGRIKDLLIDMAEKALLQARNSICMNCSYQSEEAEFKDNQCPKCGSKNLIAGRDKIAVFKA